MSDKKVRGLIIFASFIMIFSGVILYLTFDKQGFGKNTNGNYVNLDVNDYVEISPISFKNEMSLSTIFVILSFGIYFVPA